MSSIYRVLLGTHKQSNGYVFVDKGNLPHPVKLNKNGKPFKLNNLQGANQAIICQDIL